MQLLTVSCRLTGSTSASHRFVWQWPPLALCCGPPHGGACCHLSCPRHLVTRGVLLPQGPLRKMVGKVLRQLLERADKESLVAGLEDERLGDMDDEADGLMDDEDEDGGMGG